MRPSQLLRSIARLELVHRQFTTVVDYPCALSDSETLLGLVWNSLRTLNATISKLDSIDTHLEEGIPVRTIETFICTRET